MKKITTEMFHVAHLGRPVNDFRQCDERTINAFAFVCPTCGKLHIAHNNNINEYIGNTLKCSCGTMFLLSWAISHTERGHLDLHPGTLEHFVKVEQINEPIRKILCTEGKLLVDSNGKHLVSLDMINNAIETQSLDIDFLIDQLDKDEYSVISNTSLFNSHAWYINYCDITCYAKHWYSNAIALIEAVANHANGSMPAKFVSEKPKKLNCFAKMMTALKRSKIVAAGI